jgi:anti-sigma B factor antagonist
MYGSAHRPAPAGRSVALGIEIVRRPEQATVRLTGEIDMVTAGELADVLSRLLEERCGTVEVDLSGVGFMSAAGLAVLVEHDRRCRSRSGRLVLVRPSPMCARVFTITRLDAVLTIR